ncbi:integral membrane protein [Paenibacillus taiwanensis]|uniref:integral membrane protein n=1 Tax=Paenibacillus taiwanensis TaxID=401638 RepID=UPI000420BBC4|nr:integral membrane protein [Paenibacillus taiwanensis]
MYEQPLRDMNINGVGSSSGGSFHRITLNGMATINGDASCNSFRGSGTSKVKGSLTTPSAQIDGTCSINGHLRAAQCRINGMATVDGMLNSDTLETQGKLTVHRDCEAERVTINGMFSIDGLLNAGTIDATILGACRAREIGGESITVRQGRMNSFSRMVTSLFTSPYLEADTIEGDEIVLEYTKARIVRGSMVVIGPGCEIDHVEYKVGLDVHNQAKVNRTTKL